jgi:hypothetical protein
MNLYNNVPPLHQSYENIGGGDDDETAYENCSSPIAAPSVYQGGGGFYENIGPDSYENVPSAVGCAERLYENLETGGSDNVYENYDFGENKVFQDVMFTSQRGTGGKRLEHTDEAGIQQFIRSIEEVRSSIFSLFVNG